MSADEQKIAIHNGNFIFLGDTSSAKSLGLGKPVDLADLLTVIEPDEPVLWYIPDYAASAAALAKKITDAVREG